MDARYTKMTEAQRSAMHDLMTCYPEDRAYHARRVATHQRCASSRANRAILDMLIESGRIVEFNLENGCLIAK